jgi:ubiquinone/menaquinone biosynthesis C-methylase UbiE
MGTTAAVARGFERGTQARVLDLGCGTGHLPLREGIRPTDEVVGVDINQERLAAARERFPERRFYLAPAESLPFPSGSFDRVISNVALPYMDIPKALAEVRRVLVPGGTVLFTLHPLRFTLSELRKAFPRVIATAFRLFVILNGVLLHLTGSTVTLNGRSESFQTKHGIRRLLERAGFERIEFSQPAGRLIVRARVSGTGEILSQAARRPSFVEAPTGWLPSHEIPLPSTTSSLVSGD